MGSRLTITFLAILALITTLGAGIFYIVNVGKTSIVMAQMDNRQTLSKLNDQISLYMDRNVKIGQVLAGLRPLQDRLQKGKNQDSINNTNMILDHLCSVLEGYVCYLMDTNGTTIAASNRLTAASFLGKNYSFRPYFKKALDGNPAIYLAMGVTSNKRGIYTAIPVQSSQEQRLGVVVLKAPIEEFESLFSNLTGIVVFINDAGRIFASNQKNWLFKTLWKEQKKSHQSFSDSQQFGINSYASLDFIRQDDDWAKTPDGNRFKFAVKEIDSLPGWSLIYMRKVSTYGLSGQNNINPVSAIYIFIIIIVCLIIAYLYRSAKDDLEQRIQAEKKLWHLAKHDDLTKLPSIPLGMDRLSEAIAMAKRNKTMVGIMFIDLDGFKEVNDSLGHEAGDKLLKELSTRLLSCVREVDTVARYGGDEFLIVLANMTNKAIVDRVAQSLINVISKPYTLSGLDTFISASIGIALYPEHGEQPETLLKLADKAMYAVKRTGRNHYKFTGT